jgi:hypothetical protein
MLLELMIPGGHGGGGGNSSGVLIALIGALATIIAAYFAYKAATGKAKSGKD